MAHWAKTDGGHIARFGELTKREIQVVSFLYLCRNGDNNRCNPKRKAIAAGTGLAPPHVTIAIAGLERKGWIVEGTAEGFYLRDAADIPPAEKVTKLVTNPAAEPVEKSAGKVTKSVNNAESEVTKSVTKITKSVKNNYQFGNEHIKDIEQSSNRVLNSARAAGKNKKKKPPVEKTRIPEPFELTDEMTAWFRENVPGLRIGPVAAHLNFVNYWTDAEGKRALKSNWLRTWKVGMSKLLEWQNRDDERDAAARKDPKGRPGPPGSYVGENDYQPSPDEIAERERLAALPDCFICDNSRWTVRVVDPDARFSWQREQGFPCDACRPDEYRDRFSEFQAEKAAAKV
jgi:hypothetical protein